VLSRVEIDSHASRRSRSVTSGTASDQRRRKRPAFLDAEEVRGSNPLAPTDSKPIATHGLMSSVSMMFRARSRSVRGVLAYERITAMSRVPSTSRMYRCQRLPGPCA
jgi:hypothetical protein